MSASNAVVNSQCKPCGGSRRYDTTRRSGLKRDAFGGSLVAKSLASVCGQASRLRPTVMLMKAPTLERSPWSSIGRVRMWTT